MNYEKHGSHDGCEAQFSSAALRALRDPYMRKIIRELRREFPAATVEVAAGNHYRLRLSNGRSVTVSATPGDRRFLQNVRSNVRREMLIKDGHHD